MRWDRLFDDLEGQLERELDVEAGELAAEEERLRLGRLALRDRIVAMVGSARRELDLVLRDGTPLRVDVGSTGRDWIAGEIVAATRASVLVPLASVAAVAPIGGQLALGLAAESLGTPRPPGELAGRLGLAFVLRDLCRRRSAVDVDCGWAVLHGTIDRVGRDHLDLAEHDRGEPRRRESVRRTRILPFGQILCIRF